ncbi:hypothetical protein NEPAR03_2203 [Nematocida parisii]|nr:hypothetical protein NEPAR03_2203 [Nematocida parisii]KAI5146509.1 hypothetical protein NEPAR07_2432 [Nematocida parisii]
MDQEHKKITLVKFKITNLENNTIEENTTSFITNAPIAQPEVDELSSISQNKEVPDPSPDDSPNAQNSNDSETLSTMQKLLTLLVSFYRTIFIPFDYVVTTFCAFIIWRSNFCVMPDSMLKKNLEFASTHIFRIFINLVYPWILILICACSMGFYMIYRHIIIDQVHVAAICVPIHMHFGAVFFMIVIPLVYSEIPGLRQDENIVILLWIGIGWKALSILIGIFYMLFLSNKKYISKVGILHIAWPKTKNQHIFFWVYYAVALLIIFLHVLIIADFYKWADLRAIVNQSYSIYS